MPKTQSKSSSNPTRPSGQKDGVTMVLRDKAAALKSLTLPADAQVAIVSKSGTALRKIRERNKQLVGYEVRFFSEPATAKAPVVSSDAFAPNARALAILEGVSRCPRGSAAIGRRQ